MVEEQSENINKVSVFVSTPLHNLTGRVRV